MSGTNARILNIVESFTAVQCRHVGTSADHRHCRFVCQCKRLAGLRFKQGGMPGYGLRRMLISATGTPKQQLTAGERKSITTDRVILVPSPAQEVEVIENIYRMLVSEKLSIPAIARDLNRRGISFRSKPYSRVRNTLGVRLTVEPPAGFTRHL
jgi:hypothetical protein